MQYRLYYNDPSFQATEAALESIRPHAAQDGVVAAADPHWAYLRTGRTTILTPFESNAETPQRLLDMVPVRCLDLQGGPVIAIDCFVIPVAERHSDSWRQVFSHPQSDVSVSERNGNPPTRGVGSNLAIGGTR